MFTGGDEFLLLAKCTGEKKKNLAVKHLNTDSPETIGGKKTSGRMHTQKNGNYKLNSSG